MWKLVSIRRSYDHTDHVLVWVRDLTAVMEVLPLLKTDAATCHTYQP